MTEFVSGNNFIRTNKMEKAGEVVDGHAHNFDHTTIVFKGTITVSGVLQNGTPFGPRTFKAPGHVLIRAGVKHHIVSEEDDTEFWCVYSHREPDGTIVPNYTGWEPAYH